ncbi:MAG: hypothetical protein RJB08_1147 [Actinomycetota bacterium]
MKTKFAVPALVLLALAACGQSNDTSAGSRTKNSALDSVATTDQATTSTATPTTLAWVFGAACNDNNAATIRDAYDPSGRCVGRQLNCDDSNPLTNDSANPETGCVHTPLAEGTRCDDNDPTTGDGTVIYSRGADGAVTRVTCGGASPLPAKSIAPTTTLGVQNTPSTRPAQEVVSPSTTATNTTVVRTTTTTLPIMNFVAWDLSRASLVMRDFTGADFSRAILAEADLRGANLSAANLTGADLSRANLSRANLSRANLTRVRISGTNWTGAILNGATLPSGFNCRTSGAVGCP